MCDMLNLFVPGPPVASLGSVRELHFGRGELHPELASRFAGQGVVLAGSVRKGCLCGFTDWDALYDLARAAIEAHRLPELVALRFWSREQYRLTERTIDLDDGPFVPLVRGEMVRMRLLPPEQRRHRDVARALERRVGSAVTLRMRKGRVLSGTLDAFDAESDVGSVDAQPFVAWEVLEVDA